MLTTLLFPLIPGIRVRRLTPEPDVLRVEVVTTRRRARCPLCRRRSRRVHSDYARVLRDLPCAGRAVVVELHVRRFVCGAAPCVRRIFAEQVPDLVAPRARSSQRLRQVWQRHGFDLGGEAGARHLRAEAMPASPRTLLRLVRAAPLPEVGQVRVVGIDDFSRRRGRTYGTVIVDLEAHRPVDLLPERTTAVVRPWLEAHPEIAVISRDRAAEYADAGRQGAPQAVQVADRWHLLANLSAAAEEALLPQHAVLRAAAQAVAQQAHGVSPADSPAPRAPEPPASGTEARRERRTSRYAEVRTLHAQGATVTEITRRVGLCPKTVRTYLRLETLPARPSRKRPSPLVLPHVPYLQQRWEAGCQRADRLYTELCDRGYRGSARTLRRFLRTWRPRRGPRGRTADVSNAGLCRPSAPPRLFSVRQTVALFFRPEADLDATERAYLAHLSAHCAPVTTVHRLVQQFHTLVRERGKDNLAPWLAAVEESGVQALRRFGQGLRRDTAAVEAALSLEWSQGQVEGTVTKIKLIKRSMYGRCNFDLLRRRVLNAS